MRLGFRHVQSAVGLGLQSIRRIARVMRHRMVAATRCSSRAAAEPSSGSRRSSGTSSRFRQSSIAEAHLRVDIEPGQAGEPAKIAAVRHEADEGGVVDRTDLDREAALDVPIALADHGVRREAGRSAGAPPRAACAGPAGSASQRPSNGSTRTRQLENSRTASSVRLAALRGKWLEQPGIVQQRMFGDHRSGPTR